MRIYYCDKCGAATEKSNLLKTLTLKAELPSMRKSDGQYIKELLLCKNCYNDYLNAIEQFLKDSFAAQKRAAMATSEQVLEWENDKE